MIFNLFKSTTQAIFTGNQGEEMYSHWKPPASLAEKLVAYEQHIRSTTLNTRLSIFVPNGLRQVGKQSIIHKKAFGSNFQKRQGFVVVVKYI